MPSSEQNVQECDATDDDSPKGLGSTPAGYSSIPPEGEAGQAATGDDSTQTGTY